jgi:hypothetical protein
MILTSNDTAMPARSLSIAILFSMLVFFGSRNDAGALVPATESMRAGLQVESSLRLTTSVVESRYEKERGNNSSANLRLKLQLRYLNVGSKSLILYKHDNTVFRQMISRSVSEAESQRYLSDLSLTTVTDGAPGLRDTAVPTSHFIVLPAGGFYETETDLTIFVRRGGSDKESDGLAPGEYALLVSVSTWPDEASLADRLRNRWNELGILWSKNVTSLPMPFTVEDNPKLSAATSRNKNRHSATLSASSRNKRSH